MNRKLKPVVFVVENAVKVVKFLTTGLADFVLWLDKVTGNQDLYKAGDNMVKYAKKVQDDYVNSDAAGKKKILEQQQKYADEAAKKSDASSKRAYDTHMKLINDLQQLDLKGTPEETDAEFLNRLTASNFQSLTLPSSLLGFISVPVALFI